MNWGRVFFGLLVVAVGVVLLLDNAGSVDAWEIFSTWWPAVVVLAGILTFAANPRHWPVALIITLVGVAFLLSNLGVVDIGDFIIPAAIILVGLLVLFGRGLGSRTEAGDRVNSFNIFSGSEIASAYGRFGTEVLLIEMLDQILPAEDRDMAKVVERVFKKQGIAVSTGSACSSGTLEPSHVLRAMGRDDARSRNAIRFSLGWATTDADIDAVIAVMPDLVGKLRRLGRAAAALR